jgi:hypothetical protein
MADTTLELAQSLAETLRAIRFTGAVERELQDLIEGVLVSRGDRYVREFAFNPEDRVDFLVAGPGLSRVSVALEVKVQGSPPDVMRQLQRYARHQVVDTVLLVTTKARLGEMPPTLRNKPIVTAVLRGFP